MLTIRTNGRGNAWPIPLGQQHPFYDINNVNDLANASFSILKKENTKIEKEVLIDAGHGTIQFLLQNQNRIPEAIVLTHPHIDHTLSVDWVAQSYYRFTKKKYPLYASKMCWELTLQFFPHLEKIIDFKELLPACEHEIEEFTGLSVTFYPAFHGESALGAGMLFFNYSKSNTFSKALFTGDLLCPLLREGDYKELSGCEVIYVDCNNRFPYPKSNHWSIAKPDHFGNSPSELFTNWYNEKGKNLSWLCRPNIPIEFNPQIHNYFNDFIRQQSIKNTIPFTVFDFGKKIKPKNVNLVHYSGKEDNQHNNHEIMNETKLKKWANESAKKIGLKSKFLVPKVGDEFDWI